MLARNERLRIKRLKQRRVRKRRITHRHRLVGIIPQKDVLISILANKLGGKTEPVFDKKLSLWVIKFPKIFCLINNPRGTIDTIYSIVNAYAKKGASSFLFDQADCEEIGLSASALLDVIAMEIRDDLKRKRIPCRYAGNLPRNIRARNLIQRMGITRHLKVPGTSLPDEIHNSFIVFDLFFGRKPAGSDLMRTTSQEIAASDLVRFLDKCLKQGKYELQLPDQRQILKWVGEIITNAEDHSGEGKWYIIACLSPCADTSESVYECQIGIINFGRSIYESLNDANTPRQTLVQIKKMAENHLTRKFFRQQEYEPEDLWTLYALQDGVSRFSVRPGESTRGKGTVEMIEAFQYLGRSATTGLQPCMSLVTGSSLVLFDGKYHMRPMQVESGSRKILAFNESNLLEEKPDKENVYSLKPMVFPGTILSFRFYIDSKHLATLKL
jgi:hypothetical protein